MNIGGVFGQIGKDLLKTAFPGVYNTSAKYRDILSRKKTSSDDIKKNPIVKSINALNRSTKETNEVSTDILESILVQNDILGKIAKHGGVGGIVGAIEDFVSSVGLALGTTAAAGATGAVAKKVASRVFRGKNGRYMSAEQAKANPAAVAEEVEGAAKAVPKTASAASKAMRFGGKLLRGAPILAGAIEGYEEYEEHGDLAKAGVVGAGGAAGAWGGAVAGAALGTALIPVPILGTAIGGLAGGIAGSYLGAKGAGAGYDLATKPHDNIDYSNLHILNYKTSEILFKADEIQLSAMDIILPRSYGGGGQSGYEGGPNSVYAKGGVQRVDTPVFRRGVGGPATQDGSRSSVGSGTTGPSRVGITGPIGVTSAKGDVPGRPDLKSASLTESLKQGNERFYHAQGNVEGVDKRLISTLKAASKDLPAGYRMEMMSGHDSRSTGTTNHPGGVAVDVKLYDDKGKLIPHSGNSPGWKYYEQMYKSVQERGKVMHPGSDWIWGGAWVGAAAGPGDPMHYQIKSNVPGASSSSGMYDPKTGFDKNSGVNQGINFKANAMTTDERESYVNEVRARIKSEQQPPPQQAPTPAPEASAPQPVKPPPGPVSYNVDMKGLVKKIKDTQPGASFVSDDYIKSKIKEGVPQGVKLEGNKISGLQTDLDQVSAGFKERGIDTADFLRPVEDAPERSAPGPAPANPQLQRLTMERDKLKKDLTRAKKKVKENTDNVQDDGGNEVPPPKDNTRSDRALFNINPQLHEDQHPQ